MGTILEVLQKIREKPALYLGRPSVNNLYVFLQGYTFARGDEAREDYEFLAGFNECVRKRFHINTSQGWAKTIEFFSLSPESELTLFWELLDNYLAQRKPARRKVS
jgi:hypothetical protein